jgi:hypothetical protein
MWATRLWWLLCYFGHDDASVLDGGLVAWTAADGPVGSGENSPLGELERIWTTGFTDKGKQHDPLATCLKNDLGSYAQAVFSK